jgi:lactate permease
LRLVLASLPLAAALWLLVGRRWPGWRAGLAAYAMGLALAALGPFDARPLLAANVRGLLLAAVVLYVLVAGLLLYNILARAGAIAAIARALGSASRDPARQALVLAGGLSPFFESVSGFGLAVVIVGPLLVGLGFTARRATLLALLGQNAVPWGALAVGTLIGADLAGVSARDMGVGSGWLSAPLALLYDTLAVAVAAGPGLLLRRVPDILIGAGVLASVLVWASASLSVELAGVLAGLAATAALLAWARLVEGGSEEGGSEEGRSGGGREPPGRGRPAGMSPARAAAPYTLLVAGLLATRLVPPLREWLEQHLVIDAAAYGVRLPMLYSPAFLLLLAAAFAIVLFGLDRTTVREAARATLRQWWPAAGATATFLALSTVMLASGMTPTLAAAAAAAAGPAFVWLSPLVGGLGGFMTGSNTGGNAMFARFQVETAARAGLPADLLAYGNNTAAANATMASPSRVVLATTVTGLRGDEGAMLRRIAPAVLLALGVIAVHLAAWTAVREAP